MMTGTSDNQLMLTTLQEVDNQIREHVRKQLRAHHFAVAPEAYDTDGSPRDWRPFDIIGRNADGTIVAGLLADLCWNTLYISFLWVDETLRGKGIGTRLVQRAEVQARRQGCVSAWLRCYSYDAPDFYHKLGYQVVGQLDDLPPGHTLYTMRKDFEL